MFRLCGIDHYETAHSKIIAGLLNLKGPYKGLSPFIFESFLEHMGLDYIDADTAKVYTECGTDKGRIDILIKDGDGKAVIIENKIYATDQPKQLKRYNEFGKEKYGKGNYQILYLTLYGEDASEQSCGGKDYELDYTRASYEKEIIGWLEFMAFTFQDYPFVTTIFDHYREHIEQLTITGMDAKEKQKIANIISADPVMMESAHRVFEAWDFCKSNVCKKLGDTIEEVANTLKLECRVYDDFRGGKYDSSAKIYRKEWDFAMLFYFADNSSSLEFGLWHRDSDNLCSEKEVAQLQKLLTDDFDTPKSNWIAVKDVEEWNENRWAHWTGADGEKRLYDLVFGRMEKVLKRLGEEIF